MRRISLLSKICTAALALTIAPMAWADLDATVYADWQRDGVLHGDSGDITFEGLTQLGQFVDPNISHWDGTLEFKWMPLGRDELYSVLWTGFLNVPDTGMYQFRTTSDDGVQVLLGGSKVIDFPDLQHYGTHTGSTSLSAGLIPIEVRFYENAGYDGIRLEWMKPGDNDWTIVPGDVLSVPEPETYAMLLAGLGVMGIAAKRRRKIERR